MEVLASLFLTPVKWLWRGMQAIGGWLLAKPIRGVLFMLVLHVGAHQLVIDPRLQAKADRWQAASTKWQEAAEGWQLAHGTLLNTTRRQRALAAVLDRQNARRVEQEQAIIIEETTDAFEARLADRDAALGRLQHQLRIVGPAAGGSGGSAAAVPGDYTARCQAFGAADCDALLATLPGQLSAAEENTAKLISLQDWASGLLGIDFNGEGEQP